MDALRRPDRGARKGDGVDGVGATHLPQTHVASGTQLRVAAHAGRVRGGHAWCRFESTGLAAAARETSG